MERIDPLPGALGPSLTAAGIAPDTVRVTVRSDLDASGAFGESWFVLAESEMVVLDARASRAPTSGALTLRPSSVAAYSASTPQATPRIFSGIPTSWPPSSRTSPGGSAKR